MTPADRLVALGMLATKMACDTSAIDEAARVIIASIKAGGTVYACGNGGSMAQAQHFAAELTGRYKRERRPIPAIALGSSGAHVTALANDYGYREVFARELRGYLWAAEQRYEGCSDDVVVCLSTSGKSPNVSEAALVARGFGNAIVAIVGEDAPRWTEPATLVRIPSTDTALIQEGTLSVLHSICEAIDEEIE